MSYKIGIFDQKDWPPLLKEINDPPERLYIAGKVPDYNRKFLCVVGSRKNTQYGKDVAEMLLEGLRNYPVTIVSGLALGMDSIAHRAALVNNLPTISIPGSGLNPEALHPQTNKKLAEEIVEKGGTLISEMEPDMKATLWSFSSPEKKVFYSFPKRNRLMAGMCHATLIVEANIKSGTLITARLATEYNRDVLTIPNSIFNSTSAGPHMLLRLGATPIRNADDLLEALHINKKDEDKNNDEKKYFDCGEKEMILIELLGEPMERDELIRRAQMPIGEVQTLLTLLELKNLIKESLGEIRLT